MSLNVKDGRRPIKQTNFDTKFQNKKYFKIANPQIGKEKNKK